MIMYENAAVLHAPTLYVVAECLTYNCVESN
nr:MAG TPA: hypothetical protein [Caudoviricetes sp.]